MATPEQTYDQAVALYDEGDVEGAVEKLREVLKIDEQHAVTHAALAVYLHKLGQFEDAIRHSVRVTEIDPNDPFSFTQLSVIYQRCGRIPEAEDAMARAHTVRAQGGH